MAAHSPPPAPEWLTGIWRRESIVYSDGTEDRSTCVLWGQTRSRYVDLRIPADRPPARGRRSFDDFSEGELLLLAEQMGFAGHVVLKGDVCTWIRYIDYQPNTGRPDSGRLELNGDALHERGEASSVLGRDYHEIFHREHKAERCCALQSFAPTQGGVNEEGTARAVLILIDNHFLFAQARSEELPQGQSLRELVLAAGKDRSLIHRYLDCEISVGKIEVRGWSSLRLFPSASGNGCCRALLLCREGKPAVLFCAPILPCNIGESSTRRYPPTIS